LSELSDAQCDLLRAEVDALDVVLVGVENGFECYGLRANWPPPTRGTHSSDYPSGRRCPCADATTQTARYGPVPDQTYEAHLAEYEAAARWSRGL
jgi:hypothetical protein